MYIRKSLEGSEDFFFLTLPSAKEETLGKHACMSSAEAAALDKESTCVARASVCRVLSAKMRLCRVPLTDTQQISNSRHGRPCLPSVSCWALGNGPVCRVVTFHHVCRSSGTQQVDCLPSTYLSPSVVV